MASGVISVLFHADYEVIALEQPAPWCVRRAVCFAEAVYDGLHTVGDITAVRMDSIDLVYEARRPSIIPVLIDPDARSLRHLQTSIVVDGRMLKAVNDCSRDLARVVIGLGPGFTAGDNCHAAIETNRGHDLGWVYYTEGPLAYTGTPAAVNGYTTERVVRAPADGVFNTGRGIGEFVAAGEKIGQVDDIALHSPLAGVIRGLLRDGLHVRRGRKLGDIDPRGETQRCFRISNKATTIGRGVLNAISGCMMRSRRW